MIAHFEIDADEQDFLQRKLPEAKQIFFRQPLTESELQDLAWNLQHVQAISVFVDSEITDKVLRSLPELRLICTRSTGIDHIDPIATKVRQVQIKNVADYGSYAVAEHAFGLLLCLARHLPQQYYRSKQNDFRYKDLLGMELAGKTLGVLGAGHIGRQMTRIALGFGMQVMVYDPQRPAGLDSQCQLVDKDTLLARSDIISLHAPYTLENHHLIGKDEFAKMSPGVILLNTSRGGLVDTQALLEALEKRIVSMAGLDVLTIDGHTQAKWQTRLLAHPRVMFTPHTAYYTKEAKLRILQQTVKNLQQLT